MIVFESVWELRRAIESNMPLWTLLLFPAVIVAIVVFLEIESYCWRRRLRRKRGLKP